MNRLALSTTAFVVLAILGGSSCAGRSGPSIVPTPTAAPAAVPTPTLEPATPPRPTGWISYDSRQVGYWGIYLIRTDGTGRATPLTAHLNGEYWSAWAPDGTTIAFASFRDATGPDGNSSIYTISPDGTRLTRLTDGSGSDRMPAWSPSGEEIAFASVRGSGNGDIYIVDSAGTHLRRLTDDPAADEWPSWSPDGRRIAFHSLRSGQPQIHVMRSDGTGVLQLTFDEGAYPFLGIVPEAAEGGVAVGRVVEGSPAQRAGLREGDIIQAVDDDPITQPQQLRRLIERHQPGEEISLTVARDGGELTIAATLGTAPQQSAHPAWSPDGSRIAFASLRDGDWDIYVMGTDGSDPSPLTSNDAMDLYPTWSADGQFIAFSSDLSGNLDVFVMRADGADVTQLTDQPTDEYPPKWSPAQTAASDQPRLGPPFCSRDLDNDGDADASTSTFTREDQAFFVTFPYANMRDDLAWSVDLVMENADPHSYSEPWEDNVSGLLTVRFPNWTGYTIDVQGVHGAAIGTFPLGSLAIQLLIEGQVVQEIRCDVVSPSTDPFTGTWQGVDAVDQSTISLEITRNQDQSSGTSFLINAHDNRTGEWCSSNGQAEMSGTGVLRGDRALDVSLVWLCLPPGQGRWPPAGSDSDVYAYDTSTDTITDRWGTVYSRAP